MVRSFTRSVSILSCLQVLKGIRGVVSVMEVPRVVDDALSSPGVNFGAALQILVLPWAWQDSNPLVIFLFLSISVIRAATLREADSEMRPVPLATRFGAMTQQAVGNVEEN